MTDQFRSHSVEKLYWTLVEGEIDPTHGECCDWLVHDERHRRVRVAAPGLPEAKQASLRYRRLSMTAGASLLEVELDTGESTRFACSWPFAAIPFSATGNTGACGRSPRASLSTPGD